MQRENDTNPPEGMNAAGVEGEAQDRFWAARQQVRLQALSLFIIRSTVEKHGGNMEVDLASDCINISVPEKEKAACVREIEAQLGAIRI
jgi:hypothetical protein